MAEKTKKIKKTKAPKIEKKYPRSKLPSIFKKAYSSKNFGGKIEKKLYVPADKTYVSSLFKQSKDKNGRDVLCVPAESEFTKKEIKRLKLLAKQIKANKGRIKVVPFIAVAAVIAALGITVTIFKNPVAKMAITSGMQEIFGAKCDVGSVDIQFFDSHVTIENFAQASSDDEFKNLFEFKRLDLNFNLTNLLQAKFHAQNIEITGIELGTERKTSGKLAIKPKDKSEKAKKNDSTGFYDSLKEKIGTDPDAAKKAITELFTMYDPAAIAENIKENLQSQKVAKEVEEELKVLVENWKNKPDELKKSVEEVQNATKSLSNLNVSKVSPAEIPSLLKQIEQAGSTVKKAKADMETTLSSFEGDQKKIKQLQKKLEDSIASDKNLLSAQVSILDPKKAKSALNDSINQAGYALLGQYYPYLKDLISYASSMKASGGNAKEKEDANKKAVEKAKKESKRFAGRYVYWKKDTVPKLLVEKVHGSGSGIELFATNISSDMNKRGEPWIVKGSVKKSQCVHNANLTVDARTGTKAHLVEAGYSGSNFPLSLDLSKKGASDVIPKFEGKSNVSASIVADSDFSFSGNAKLNMNPAAVTGGELGSETATRIYTTALKSIKSLNLGAGFSFSEKSGVGLKLDTNFDTLLADAISSVANAEFENVKKDVAAKLNEQIASSETAKKYISQFGDISAKLDGQKNSFDSISKQLSQKQSELKKKTGDAAKNKASQAASNAASSFLKGLKK